MSDIVEMLRTPTGCVPPTKWEMEGDAEIKKLRNALRQIDALATRHEKGAIGKAQKIARAVLAAPPQS